MKNILLCLPVDRAEFVPCGQVKIRQCSRCHENVYVSAGALVQAGHDAALVCLNCLKPEEKQITVTRPSPAIMQELSREFGREITYEELERAFVHQGLKLGKE